MEIIVTRNKYTDLWIQRVMQVAGIKVNNMGAAYSITILEETPETTEIRIKALQVYQGKKVDRPSDF